jgi:hypothetical protein
MIKEFIDFDLLLTRGERGYRAHVLRARGGGDVGQLRWPARPALLRQLGESSGGAGFAEILEPTRSDVRAVRDLLGVLDKKDALQDLAVAVTVGKVLFAAVFRDAIRDRLRESLALAEQRNAGLSLRLHLSAAPNLARLPWECLYDPESQQFLALTDRVQVVRTLVLRGRGESRPLRRNLRILAILANPNGDLAVERERRILDGIGRRSGGRIEVEFLPEPSFACLAERLRKSSYDILHFAGHGHFLSSGQGGELVFGVKGKHTRSMPPTWLRFSAIIPA